MVTKKDDIFSSRTRTVNIEPTAEDLAEIAVLRRGVAPGDSTSSRAWPCSRFPTSAAPTIPLCEKMRRATELVKQRDPSLIVDGEMMADTAVVPEILERGISLLHPQGRRQRADLPRPAVGQHRLQTDDAHRRRGGHRAHPDGLEQAVHVLPRGVEVEEIVNMAAIAVVDAQNIERAEAHQEAGTLLANAD